MTVFKVSEPALADKEEIWNHIYTATENVDTANRHLEEITRRFALIELSPLMGRSRAKIQPNLRSFVVGNYLIYYRVDDKQIEVVRVVPGARVIENVFDLPN